MMSPIRKTLASVAALILLVPTVAHAGLFDWCCHRNTANVAVATTYAPAYVPPAVAAPAVQTTMYAPVAVAPTAITTYRILPAVPRPVTTYPTVTRYNPYSAAPVTVYRPVVPVVTTTALLPYTTYRMIVPSVAYYTPAVVAAPAPSCVVAPPATAACEMPAPSYSPPVMSSDAAALETPSLPPAQPSTTYYAPPPSSQPSTNYYAPPSSPSTSGAAPSGGTAPPPSTYQQDKPATSAAPSSTPPAPPSAPATDSKSSGPDLLPIPRTPAPVQQNSLRGPELQDSTDRVTMRPVRRVSHEVALPPQPTVRVLSADAWQPAE